jgi:hypothetical protein
MKINIILIEYQKTRNLKMTALMTNPCQRQLVEVYKYGSNLPLLYQWNI